MDSSVYPRLTWRTLTLGTNTLADFAKHQSWRKTFYDAWHLDSEGGLELVSWTVVLICSFVGPVALGANPIPGVGDSSNLEVELLRR
jgi:hypothetical protein